MVPFAAGGEALADNIQVRCKAHNAYEADRYFGPRQSTVVRESAGPAYSVRTEVIKGDPNPRHISTSYVERQNLTMRMSRRRFTRLTNGFSKKAESYAHAVPIHYMH